MAKSTETKRRKRKLIVYETLVLVLLAIAGIVFFINHVLAVVSIPLLLGGLIFAAFALRLSLINNGSTHSIANWWWTCIAIPAVILCVWLFCIEISPSENGSAQVLPTNLGKSHLQLALRTEGERGFPLMLTNAPFNVDMTSNLAIFPNDRLDALVWIPVLDNAPRSRVVFILYNDSGQELTDLGVKVNMPTNEPFGIMSGWEESVIDDPALGLVFQCEIKSIIPKKFQELPTIDFATDGPKIIQVGFSTTASGTPLNAWYVNLHFIRMHSPGRPFSSPGHIDRTNSDGSVHWTFDTVFKNETNASGMSVLQGYGLWK